jgi:outer membrane protein assembly factor BamB
VLRRRRLVVFLGLVTVVFGLYQLARGGSSSAPRRTAVHHRDAVPPTTLPPPPVSMPVLRDGSDPRVVPRAFLIADRGNDRLVELDGEGRELWTFPRPGDLAPGQSFGAPDRAFFSAYGRYIVVTQAGDSTVSVIDVAAHRIVWQYGARGVPGSGPNRLATPATAVLLRDRTLVVADAESCRVLLIRFGAHAPSRSFGDAACRHGPPVGFAEPNAAFPTGAGELLVTETAGGWVDQFGVDGQLALGVRPRQVANPSGTNELSPGVFLTVDRSDPGAVVVFDRTGRTHWRFAPTGADALHRPTLALQLPNGDFVVADEGGNRVVVVDPSTNTIVWQYGGGQPARGPGTLSLPGSVDLVPPNAYLQRATTG